MSATGRMWSGRLAALSQKLDIGFFKWVRHWFHIHEWQVIASGNIVSESNPNGVPIGHYYTSRCPICGNFKRDNIKTN